MWSCWMSKKVVIIITEGISDEFILKKFLEKRYTDTNIKFKVYGGDTFSDCYSTEPILNTLGNCITEIIELERFRPTDILAVFQLTDTDGCMIEDENILVDKTQILKTSYTLENILVNDSPQKKNIIERNLLKKRNTNKMIKQQKVIKNRYIYQIYYFSRNIELVFFNDLNPIQEDKTKNALRFSKNENSEPLKIISENMPPLSKITYMDRYIESWDFIKEGTNSLKRNTNFSLLLEYLDSLILS